MICLHTVKGFQVLLSNSNNSIQYQSFVCTQLKSFKYYHLFSRNWKGFKCGYFTLIIQFNITYNP